MNGYNELCRCGHTRYRHAWVPDPKDFDPDKQRRDCQKCSCVAFAGSGQFSFDVDPSEARP